MQQEQAALARSRQRDSAAALAMLQRARAQGDTGLRAERRGMWVLYHRPADRADNLQLELDSRHEATGEEGGEEAEEGPGERGEPALAAARRWVAETELRQGTDCPPPNHRQARAVG